MCLFVDVVFCQEYSQSDLQGSWKAVKKTDLDGDDGSSFTLNGKPYTVNLQLTFLEDRVNYRNSIENLETNYILNKDTLKIFHFVYTIKELSGDKLILQKEQLLRRLIYFTRNDSITAHK